jgi:hypothetical protein
LEVVDRVQQLADHNACNSILLHEVGQGRIDVDLVQASEQLIELLFRSIPSFFGASFANALDFPLINGARHLPALDAGWLDASIAECGGLVGLSPLGFWARGA